MIRKVSNVPFLPESSLTTRMRCWPFEAHARPSIILPKMVAFRLQVVAADYVAVDEELDVTAGLHLGGDVQDRAARERRLGLVARGLGVDVPGTGGAGLGDALPLAGVRHGRCSMVLIRRQGRGPGGHVARAIAGPLVAEDDLHAAVQKRQLLQAAMERVVDELGVREDRRVGLEGRLRADLVGGADAAHFARGHAALVLLLIDVPAAADLDLAPFGEEIDDRHADAVQTAGGLISALANLPPNLSTVITPCSVEKPRSGMLFDGDAAAVVFDRHRAVVVDRDGDMRGMAGHGFVDRVVDDFVHHVVQPAERRCRRCTCSAARARAPGRSGAASPRPCNRLRPCAYSGDRCG